jgi:hypothetical protein
MSTSSEDLAGKFLAEITTAIDKHTKAYMRSGTN